ncbi:hypothetical protein ABZ802_31645 [Streptomyces sp. NPDC047737]|uniref:hypothetical protein n=1 Tax=Streptomyces sp. NPDC047737 TaxID=3155740 RepID=UPI0033E9EC1F
MTMQTAKPMTPDREQEIRTLDLLKLMSDRAAPVISGHLAVLLAEVDRLRARVAELEAQAKQSRTEAIADVGDWFEEIGEKDAAYLVRTHDIPEARATHVARPTGLPALSGRARHDARVAAERTGGAS